MKVKTVINIVTVFTAILMLIILYLVYTSGMIGGAIFVLTAFAVNLESIIRRLEEYRINKNDRKDQTPT